MKPTYFEDIDQWADDELGTARTQLLDEISAYADAGYGFADMEVGLLVEELRPIEREMGRRSNMGAMALALEELTDAGFSYSRALVMLNVD